MSRVIGNILNPSTLRKIGKFYAVWSAAVSRAWELLTIEEASCRTGAVSWISWVVAAVGHPFEKWSAALRPEMSLPRLLPPLVTRLVADVAVAGW